MDDDRPAWSYPRRLTVKILTVAMAVFCRTYVPFAALGVWNRVFGGWRSVFFCYAGSRNFITSYAPSSLVAMFRWVPSPIAILFHNGARGLVLAAPVSEEEFLDPANRAQFRSLQLRLRRIAWLVGAREVNLAGILPGVIKQSDVLDAPDTRATVVAAVSAAVAALIGNRFAGKAPSLIVLGGGGYVGRPLTQSLCEDGFNVTVVDPKGGVSALPIKFKNRPCILIDISRAGAIQTYVPDMWPGLIVLNETFPQPPGRVVRAMTARGVDVFHLSGLEGDITPPLPFGYANAIPCCAAHGAGPSPRIKLVQLGNADQITSADLAPAQVS